MILLEGDVGFYKVLIIPISLFTAAILFGLHRWIKCAPYFQKLRTMLDVFPSYVKLIMLVPFTMFVMSLVVSAVSLMLSY